MTADDPPAPSIEIVHGVYCGVREFAPTVRVLRDGLGWRVLDLDEVSASDARELWGVDAAPR